MTTPQPSNQSELQLYQVLQRANLLQYYNVFIGQGGDDVRQLCEAGEEEFLEIMALVGMASKPLHVRRLQKALQEWVTNPTLFAQNIATLTPPPPAPGSIMANIARSIAHGYCSPENHNLSNSSWSPQALVKNDHQRSASAPQSPTMSAGGGEFNSGMMVIKPEPNISPQSMVVSHVGAKADPVFLTASPAVSPNPDVSLDVIGVSESESSCDAPTSGKNVPLYYYNNMVFNSSTSAVGEERNTNSPQAMLSEAQILTIADAAKRLAKNHPVVEPKWMNIKKSLCREIEELIAMPRDDPMQLEKMRKYGAIYGRFDSKRKNEKHMSLHEISVNEASAQLCSLIPALLTRREELFPLARQIVRDSGYQYAKGHSRSGKRPTVSPQLPSHSNDASTKKVKMEASINPRSKMTKLEKEQAYKEARLKKIAKELSEVAARQEELRKQIEEAKLNGEYDVLPALQEELDEQNTKQVNLVTAQSELSRKKRPYNRKQPVVENTPAGMFELQALMSMGHHGEMHNGHSGLRFDFSQFNTMPLNMTGVGLKHTLLDEGLRIATQYGMVDFAAELQGLKEPPTSCMPQDVLNLSSQSVAKISRSTVTETQSVVPVAPVVVTAGECQAGVLEAEPVVTKPLSVVTEMPNVCQNSSLNRDGDVVHSHDVDAYVDVEVLSKAVPENTHDAGNDSEAEVDVEILTTKTVDDNDNNIKSQMSSPILNYSVDSHMPTSLDSSVEECTETKYDTDAMDADLANDSDSERCSNDGSSSSLPLSPNSAAGTSRPKKPTWKMAHWLAGESG